MDHRRRAKGQKVFRDLEVRCAQDKMRRIALAMIPFATKNTNVPSEWDVNNDQEKNSSKYYKMDESMYSSCSPNRAMGFSGVKNVLPICFLGARRPSAQHLPYSVSSRTARNHRASHYVVELRPIFSATNWLSFLPSVPLLEACAIVLKFLNTSFAAFFWMIVLFSIIRLSFFPPL